MVEELIEILKFTNLELKNKLFEYLNKKMYSAFYEDGFLYAKGDIPILLIAHMDTILKQPPQNIIYNKKFDVLYSNNGIGGDDRCGVYAIMQLLESYKPHVLFTEGEEIGGIGASKAVAKLEKPDVKFMIELDRKGNNDCVFYDCQNVEFKNFIKNFGFVPDYGTFSDISILGWEWNIAAVNLSIGYYDEHTKEEYIKIHEVLSIINRVKKMLDRNYDDMQQYSYFCSNQKFSDDKNKHITPDDLRRLIEKYYMSNYSLNDKLQRKLFDRNKNNKNDKN